MGFKPISAGGQQSEAVKRALKNCKASPCECLESAIENLLSGGTGPNAKTIPQKAANMLSPSADPPGTLFNGKDTFANHASELEARKRGLDRAMDEWDAQGCGPPPPGVTAAQATKVPTPADYFAANPNARPAQSSGPSTLARVGWGVLGVGAAVGAAALLFVPFDGPFGEAAAGTAAVGAFGLAFQ